MSFLEPFLAALGGTSAAVLVLGYLARNLLENRLKKDLEDHKALKRDWENERKIQLEEQASIRAAVKRYSRVILISAGDLQDRLWHLCVRQSKSKNKVLLAEDDCAQMYGSWPMTKKHYLIGTMYLFCRFFCWVEVLKANVRFLEFNDDDKSNEFNYHLKRVERMFAETDLQAFSETRVSTDKQVFQLMQGEIGEHLRVDTGAEDQCMSYHEFRINYEEIRDGNEGILQLEAMLLSSMSDAKSNFCMTRLRLICNSLRDLVLFLLEHNELGTAEEIEKVDVPSFDEKKYLSKWPSVPNKAMQRTAFGCG
ncbi:hypothetical protein [Neptunomonas sp.]|uniref:hypothetical protein n=1 Tax=Neptunomonas sp. TaxID=1971898 RepID=UPI0035627561